MGHGIVHAQDSPVASSRARGEGPHVVNAKGGVNSQAGRLPSGAFDVGGRDVRRFHVEAETGEAKRLRPYATSAVEQWASFLRRRQKLGENVGLSLNSRMPVLEDQVIIERQLIVSLLRIHRPVPWAVEGCIYQKLARWPLVVCCEMLEF